MFGSHQRKGASMDAVEMHERRFQNRQEERKHLANMERTARQGHRQIHLQDEDIPAKRLRTSRLSDDSTLQVDIAYDR